MIVDNIRPVGTNQVASICSAYFSEEAPQKIWEQSQPANTQHPYLLNKQVKPYGIRQCGNELIVPMYDCNRKLQNLQRIFPYGKKLFLPNRITKGCLYILGTVKTTGIIYIAEGYATAATIHEATGQCTVVAFSAGNLSAVAETIKWEYPNAEIIICADNDSTFENNIGLDKATEAAALIDAKLVIPQFKNSAAEIKPTDFNDLSGLEGIDEVRRQLTNAKKVGAQSIETSEVTIKRLAQLGLVEYGQIRRQEANRLKIPVGFLDNAVKNYKQLTVTSDSKNELEAGIKPWEQKVEGAQVAEEIQQLIKKHAILSDYQITTLTLWVFGTYCLDAFGIFPKLLITSPDKRCGKTTVLSILRSVVNRALVASNVTPSAMFRSIELWKPTLLIDEGDTFINNDNLDLKGVINSGHTKDTAYILRTEGDNSNRQPKQFSTWTPMALAMIKNPPDTTLDRSVVIKLRRKLASEHITKWSFENFAKLEALRQKLKRWANDNFELLKNHYPNMPCSNNDRATDNWLPLFAIASIIDSTWLINAEATFKNLNGDNDTCEENITSLLLTDIKRIFVETNSNKIHSSDLVAKLIELEDRPWGEYRYGKPITCNNLARLLRSFGIRSKQIYAGHNKHGYYLADFEDTFSRYTPLQNAKTLDSASAMASNDITNAINDVSIAFQNSR